MNHNRLAPALLQAWLRRGWLACLLWPLSALFGLLIRARLFLYRNGLIRQHQMAVPVIVVGNIFVGGTGKTPLTVWLLNQLKLAGYHPGVISRGYGGRHDQVQLVSAQSHADEVGDEPVLIAQLSGCPVAVSRNRVQAGQSLLAAFPDVNVIVADDGLQHLALQRDVEIMLFDARGTGNGWLLPAGPLREPVSRYRDLTVVNLNPGEAIPASLPPDTLRMQLTGHRARRLTEAGPGVTLDSFGPDVRIVAAAGIGNPERFFMMLRQQGLQFTAMPLPDHFDFAINPFKNLSADLILITEKDAVKCRQSAEIAADARIWVVPVVAELAAGLMAVVMNKLQKQADLKKWRTL